MKVLLENYSFEVIDLGKDVAPECIVETVLEKEVKLVGVKCSDDDYCRKHGRDDQTA